MFSFFRAGSKADATACLEISSQHWRFILSFCLYMSSREWMDAGSQACTESVFIGWALLLTLVSAFKPVAHNPTVGFIPGSGVRRMFGHWRSFLSAQCLKIQNQTCRGTEVIITTLNCDALYGFTLALVLNIAFILCKSVLSWYRKAVDTALPLTVDECLSCVAMLFLYMQSLLLLQKNYGFNVFLLSFLSR